MVAFAYGVRIVGDLSHAGCVQGLKVAAVAVVAQAVVDDGAQVVPRRASRHHCRRKRHRSRDLYYVWMQLAVIAGGAIAGGLFGLWFSIERLVRPSAPSSRHLRLRLPRLFFGLLAALPWLVRVWPIEPLRVFDGFYRSGALVFGGGHVVLRCCKQAT